MRYFVDTPMFGNYFMCARVVDGITETRTVDETVWTPWNMGLDEILTLVEAKYLVELESDPFSKEYDCQHDS
jgi:hypothetical protein